MTEKETKKDTRGMKSKAHWTPEAHARAWERLKKTHKNPQTPNSYYKKKQLLDAITDDFPRY